MQLEWELATSHPIKDNQWPSKEEKKKQINTTVLEDKKPNTVL